MSRDQQKDLAARYEYLKKHLLSSVRSEKHEGLMRAEQFSEFADSFATSLLHAAQNSTIAVVFLHRIIDEGLRQYDVLSIYDQLHEYLCSPNLPSIFPFSLYADIANRVISGNEDHLCASFFEYYWARLGKILRMARIGSQPPNRFRDHEVEILERASWLQFAINHPMAIESYKWRGEKGRLDYWSRWKIFHNRFLTALYDGGWVEDAIERSGIASDYGSGTRTVALLVINEYFPVFWNSFEGNFRLGILVSSALGRFTDQKDFGGQS